MVKQNQDMTPKQKRFCEEYLVDLNATKAAIRAGYSKKAAAEQGYDNLIKPHINAHIQGLMKRRSEKTEVTADKVLLELAIIAFSDIADYLEIDENTGAVRAKGIKEMPESASRALKSIREDRAIKEDAGGQKVTVYDKVAFTTHDKIKALELVGRHLGMFKDIGLLSNPVVFQVSEKFMPNLENRNKDNKN
ncbi:MAG: terminase small subunit [Deltaproteobacteria bacterium]|nr:terminase small subunit [Deltaproteobacteria bacterium]